MTQMDKEQEYFELRSEGRTSFTKSFQGFGRKKRFAYRKLSGDTHDEFAEVNGEIVLQAATGSRCQLKALLVEHPRGIEKLILQRFHSDGRPHRDVFSLWGQQIHILEKFLQQVREQDLTHKLGIRITDTELKEIDFTPDQISQIVSGNREMILAAINNGLTEHDVLALTYKKNQLEEFKKLLEEEEYLNEVKERSGKTTEGVWQAFFEKNTWIFGYGLAYIINAPLEGKKLEQVVSGASAFGRGKRADALMRSRAAISSICLGEIKTHQTPLLNGTQHRPDTWAPSSELTQAVAQCHRTAQQAVKQIQTKTQIVDDAGALTGEEAYLYHPKSILVIGNQAQFQGEHGVNESKYSSFEMYRKQLKSPEIVTFDELYERAKYIIELSNSDES